MKLISIAFALIAAIACYGVLIGETHQLLILAISSVMSYILWKESTDENKEKENGNEQS